MIDLLDIRYVRLGTRDRSQADRFAREVLGLELARHEAGASYFRSDDRDHTLVYFEGDPADHTVGFELRTADELESAAAELANAGVAVRLGSTAECEQRRVQSFIRFTDPTGNGIELVVGPHHGGRRYFPSRDAGITGFSHVGLCTTDAKRDERFWTQVLGARVSDRIGDAPLLRIDEVHHKVALFPTTRAGIQHVNHQVEGIDDVMRAWYLLKKQGGAHRFRAGPSSDLGRGVSVLRRSGRHGLRVLHRRAHHPGRPGGDLPAAAVPARERVVLNVGAEPDIAEFRSTPDAQS